MKTRFLVVITGQPEENYVGNQKVVLVPESILVPGNEMDMYDATKYAKDYVLSNYTRRQIDSVEVLKIEDRKDLDTEPLFRQREEECRLMMQQAQEKREKAEYKRLKAKFEKQR